MSSDRRMALTIFLVALAIRGTFIATRTDELVWPDSQDYDTIARNVLRGEGFLEADGRRASRAPGYPLFLAACYSVGLSRPRAVYAVQALAGAATCALIVLLGRRLFRRGKKPGVLAGWIAAFYPFFVYFTGLLLSETLFILGFVAYLLLVAKCDDAARTETTGREAQNEESSTLVVHSSVLSIRQVALAVGAGVLAGALTLLRSSFFLFPLFLLPFWLVRAYLLSGTGGRARPRTGALASWAVMVVAMAAVMSPWVLRNYRRFGHFIPTTLQVGESLYEANSRHAYGGPAMDRIDWVAERGGVTLEEYENNEFFKKAAVRYIREHPGRFVTLALEKFRRFWNIVPNHGPYRTPFYAVVSVFGYAPVILLALWGVVRRRIPAGALLMLLAPVLYYTAVHVVFVGSLRYRVPVMPFVILLAGAGGAATWEQWRRRAAEEGGSATAKRFSAPRRRWLLWVGGVLVVLVVLIGGGWRHFANPARLRALAQKRLSRLVGGEVLVGEAELSWIRGLILKGVRIEDRQSTTGRPAMRIDTLLLRPSWLALLTGKVVLHGMELEDVQANVELDESGRWLFLSQLRLTGEETAQSPTIFVSRARVRVSGVADLVGIPVVELSRLNATLRPAQVGGVYDAVIWSDERRLGRPRVRARFSPGSKWMRGDMTVSGLEIKDSPLRELLPTRWRERWDEFEPSQGSLDLHANFLWDPRKEMPVQLAGDVFVRDASVTHRKFPYPISKISMDLRFEDRGFRVGRFTAMVGETQLFGGGSGRLSRDGGLSWEATVRGRGIELNEELYAALPARAREFWDRVKPDGTVNAFVSLRAEPGGAEPEVRAEMEFGHCACAPPQVPVPLTDIRGRLYLAGRRLTMRGIEGRAGGAPFALRDGFVVLEKTGPFMVGGNVAGLKLEGACGELVPVDLVGLLPPAVREVLAQGAVIGEFDVAASVRRERKGGTIRLEMDATVKDTTFSHPRLPQPLTKLQGRARLSERAMEIESLTATWGKATIEMPRTQISLLPDAANRLALNFRDVPLDKALYDVLPSPFRKVWDRFDPAGVMDLDLRLDRKPGTEALFHSKAVARFRDGRMTYANFPYPVRAVSGEMVITDGVVEKAELHGRNGPAEIDVGIYAEPFDGSPGLRVVVDGKGVPLDDQLRTALRPRHQSLWDTFQPEGVLDLKCTRWFQIKPPRPGVFRYSADATLHGLTLRAPVPIEVSEGGITIEKGEHRGQGQATAQGRLHLNEVIVERKRLSDLKAAFQSRTDALAIEGVSANCYGGKLTGAVTVSGQIGNTRATPTTFRGTVNLAEADVSKIIDDADVQGLSGRLNATSTFSGSLAEEPTFAAIGAMTIRDGEIGELPGILAALNLFRLSGLDASAFHGMELVYEITGGTLYAHEMNLLGDILSLYGKGTMGKDNKMKFRFIPEIGPRVNVPGLGKVLDLIKEKAIPVTVEGDLDDPVWRVNPIFSLTRLVQGVFRSLVPVKQGGPEGDEPPRTAQEKRSEGAP